MTSPQFSPLTAARPLTQSLPTGPDGPRVPLYSPEFAADPHRVYRSMRERFGSLAPVELAPGVPATLVIGYRAAVQILHDSDHFPSDSRIWEKTVPADSPVLPVMQWRPAALQSIGAEHARYRQAILAGTENADLHAVRHTVEQVATSLIDTFCQEGSAELISQYAFPLTFAIVNAILGCPPETGQHIAAGFAAMLDGTQGETGNAMIIRALSDLVTLKRAEPGDDITTRMLRHPVALDDVEAVEQLVLMYGAGIEPMQNLIANTLVLILTDERFAGSVLGGSMLTRDALDEVLFTNPPLANLCTRYPRQPILIDNVWLPAHQPVVISMAACNDDPSITDRNGYAGNRSHLAWGAGLHACPGRSIAYLVAQEAIDQLLDVLPEIRLATEVENLTWRPGPFHRSLSALPVAFPPSPALNT
ncbi:cytochrome P450 [Nocardia albiluteola]|uniref:cytochrome P450 n=1 Tax=Nocardia albiluteola TaxID=2842303 RepID=UPI0035592F11